MVRLGPGLVVVLRFPFSDLSSSKFRPAVVLAHAGSADWVLCQVTSNPYGDPEALPHRSRQVVSAETASQDLASCSRRVSPSS